MLESEIATPVVRPISRKRSAMGAVTIMSAETGTIVRRNSGISAAQVPMDSTTVLAVTEPFAVRTRGDGPLSNPVMGVFS